VFRRELAVAAGRELAVPASVDLAVPVAGSRVEEDDVARVLVRRPYPPWANRMLRGAVADAS
jgi:hypothetical protein